MKSILIGLPTWFIAGILITFSPELAKALHLAGIITSGKSIGLVEQIFLPTFLPHVPLTL
jgi:hypothetical protein